MLTARRGRRRARGDEQDEHGFTIIEVMVSTAILMIVLTMLFSVLVSLTRNEDRSQRLVSNEQNVRLVHRVPCGERRPPGRAHAGRLLLQPCTTHDSHPSFPSTFSIGAGGANNGVVEIFIIPTDNSNITVSISDANVNLNGDPTKLRVYLAGGTIDPGNGSHSGDFTGILWAPNASEVNASCKANWRGALVLNVFTCNGGPHLQVQYDTRIQSISQPSWTVSNYTEIPSGQVTLP